MAEDSSNWRDTLYIWDGITSSTTDGVPVDDTDASTSTSTSTGTGTGKDITPTTTTTTEHHHHHPLLSWKGTWVPITNCPDATKADVPKRNAFKEFIDSDFKFTVSGTAIPTVIATTATPTTGEGEGIKKGDNEEEEDHFFVAKLTEGEGWDMKVDNDDDDDDDSNHNEKKGRMMKKKKYQDETHDVLVKKLRWSGNDCDQSEYLIVAKGMNEFGPFISVGWQRPGCRWTVARRYLQVSSSFDTNDANDTNDTNDDPRMYWSLMELYHAVLKESIETMPETGQLRLKIPPWQLSIMHVNYQQQQLPQEPESNSNNSDDGGKRKRQKTTTTAVDK
mmetsp:Transcript_49860/g.56426  ORF Transcript_49860/g.56426 Transcript_49860/m.56426 type:complete len:334 (-) Transcript_49860:213-1214(-)